MLRTAYLTPNYVVAQEYRAARPSLTARTGRYPALVIPRVTTAYDRIYRAYTVQVNGSALCDCPTRKDAQALVKVMKCEYQEMARTRKPLRCWTLRKRWALRYNKQLTARLLAA